MSRIEFLNSLKGALPNGEQPIDKYIVFMYAILGASKTDIADTLEVSRQTVYTALERNRELLETHDIVVPQSD